MKTLIIIAALFAISSAARIYRDQCLYQGTTLYSDRNCFRMNVQGDGDMVIHRVSDNKVIWKTNTYGRGGYKSCMQTDGNFVLYTINNAAIWSTRTNGKVVDFAYLQDDGQLVLKRNDGATIWVSGVVDNC